MLRFRTALEQRFAHQEIVVPLDEQSGIEPKWLVDFFEDAVAKGRRFSANETVQIGWMLVMLKENESHELEIWEPQFDSIPVKWILGANNTMRHLVLQKSTADLLRVEPEFPSLRQAGLASRAFLTAQDNTDFCLIRQSPDGNDSGWRFDVPLNSGDSSELRSLFELSFHRTGIVPFLALPNGTTVVKKGDQITVSWKGTTVDSSQNKFLHDLSSVLVWV